MLVGWKEANIRWQEEECGGQRDESGSLDTDAGGRPGGPYSFRHGLSGRLRLRE